MTKPKSKSFIENLVSSALTAAKFISEDFSPKSKKIFKLPIFLLVLILLIFAAPIILLSKLLKKKTVNPFFMLRTELETKWSDGKQLEALSDLREVRSTIKKSEQKIFFTGVNVEPYGKFKFNEYLKILWLLYHWEFQFGNFKQASEVCDYFVEQYGALNSQKMKKYRSKYYSQWVVKKAEIILKQEGKIAAQQYLMKFIDSNDIENPVNQRLYELRNENKKIV